MFTYRLLLILSAAVYLFGCTFQDAAEGGRTASGENVGDGQWSATTRSFDELYEELTMHRKTVWYSSLASEHNDCAAFREIVTRGEEFLPRIVEEIAKGDFFLNQAMREITGVDIADIFPDEVTLGAQNRSRLWVRWWKARQEAQARESVRRGTPD